MTLITDKETILPPGLHVNFDTHHAVKNLVANGFNEKQAETIVATIAKSQSYDLSAFATKEHVNNTKELLIQKYNSSESRLEHKIDMLDQKIDVSVERLEHKINMLDQKIDVSVERLNQKIDMGVEMLDQKIDFNAKRFELLLVSSMNQMKNDILKWMLPFMITILISIILPIVLPLIGKGF